MKILAVIGVPGVGKSTLMLKVLEGLPQGQRHRYGLLDYTEHQVGDKSVFVLGYYEPGQPFGGTDRLSMSVQPNAEEFLRSQADSFSDNTIIFEGDRLCTQTFLDACVDVAGPQVKLLFCRADSAVIHGRRQARAEQTGKAQNDQWLAGRVSKVDNLFKAFYRTQTIEDVFLRTITDSDVAAAAILQWSLA